MCKLKFILLFLLIALSFQSFAGWILTGRYISPEGKTIMQRWFIQDQKVKFEQYNLIYTINFHTGDIILVDPELLIYYHSTIDGYIEDYKKLKSEKLNQLIAKAGVSGENEVIASFRDEIDSFGQPMNPCTDSVRYYRLKDSLMVFGAPTEKYQLTVNGIRTEEIWISPVLNVNSQFSWKLHQFYLSLLQPYSLPPAYESSDAFNSLLDKGFPVRRIMLRDGYKAESQVSREERRDIPDYEFYIPDLCKQVTLNQWLERSSTDKTDYDDYE